MEFFYILVSLICAVVCVWICYNAWEEEDPSYLVLLGLVLAFSIVASYGMWDAGKEWSGKEESRRAAQGVLLNDVSLLCYDNETGLVMTTDDLRVINNYKQHGVFIKKINNKCRFLFGKVLEEDLTRHFFEIGGETFESKKVYPQQGQDEESDEDYR